MPGDMALRLSRARTLAGVLLATITLSCCGATSVAQPAPTPTANKTIVSIPHTQFVLPNGMTVIFHEDHTQPLVVVNTNVKVGSRDEPAQRTGFAHLFEHLMFMGTKRVPEKMFDEWMESEGGWNNASTGNDNTAYYDVGPSHILKLLLWMEADRLSELGKQITAPKLDTQRGVVRNERRQQTENRPYASARLVLPGLLFPTGHPYHHPVIGSHKDLEAAAVTDVRAFFAEHYLPDNMSLVVAGDFDPAKLRPTIERYFGSIPKGKARGPRRKPSSPAKINGVVRHTMEDTVSLPKLIMAWLSPALYAPGDAELDLLADIIASGKASRLYKTLVYDKQLAQSVVAYQSSKKLRSNFNIAAIARPGVSLSQIEQAIDEELVKVRDSVVSASELQRAKNEYETAFVARLQALTTRAALLNGYFASLGQAGWVNEDLQRYVDATPADLQRAAKQTFDPNARVMLHIVPRKKAPAGEEAKP